MRIAVISDTHGLLRPAVVARLHGADAIIHAGDVGDPEILTLLGRLAPLHAVRGNVDRGPGLDGLPTTLAVQLGGLWVYVLHDLKALDLDPVASGFGLIVSGHSHRPQLETRGGVIYLNPGSCGARRFTLPISMAFVEVKEGAAQVELVTLEE